MVSSLSLFLSPALAINPRLMIRNPTEARGVKPRRKKILRAKEEKKKKKIKKKPTRETRSKREKTEGFNLEALVCIILGYRVINTV